MPHNRPIGPPHSLSDPSDPDDDTSSILWLIALFAAGALAIYPFLPPDKDAARTTQTGTDQE